MRRRPSYGDGASDGSIYIDGKLTMTNDASICSDVDNPTGGSCTIPPTGATIPSVFFSVYNRANTDPAFSMAGTLGSSRRRSYEGSTS